MTSTTLQLVTELCQGLLSVTGGRAALDPLLSEQLCKQAKRGKTESSLPHLSHQKSVFAPCAQSKVIVLYQLYSIIYTLDHIGAACHIMHFHQTVKFGWLWSLPALYLTHLRSGSWGQVCPFPKVSGLSQRIPVVLLWQERSATGLTECPTRLEFPEHIMRLMSVATDCLGLPNSSKWQSGNWNKMKRVEQIWTNNRYTPDN